MKEKKIIAKLQEDENVEGIINLEPLRGPNGFSAYELYVKNLSEGETPLSELEWLESISKANYYRQYKQTIVTTEDNTTIIPINISTFNETCLLEAFLNGLRLDDTEYSVNYANRQIVLFNSIGKNQIVHLIVSKTIVATANDFDLLKGEKGDNGLDGQNGLDGLGVPTGGIAGQVLAKKTNDDNDTEWIDPPEGTGGGSVTGDTLPIGSLTAFAGSTIPANWLLCDGQAVSRTEYSELFDSIGTTYGTGDGSTTFNLPNYIESKLIYNNPDGWDSGSVTINESIFNFDFLVIHMVGQGTEIICPVQHPEHKSSETSYVRGGGGYHSGTNQYLYTVNLTTPMAGDGKTLTFVGCGNVKVMANAVNGAYTDLKINKIMGISSLNSSTNTMIIKSKQSAGVVAMVEDNVNSDSAINALSANQGKILNDKITDLLKWKEVGRVTNNTKMNLPESFNELLIYVYNANDHFITTIPRILLSSSKKKFDLGGRMTSSSVGYGLAGAISLTEYNLDIFYENTQNKITNATTVIYYR